MAKKGQVGLKTQRKLHTIKFITKHRLVFGIYSSKAKKMEA
jgi:hypothetical protein